MRLSGVISFLTFPSKSQKRSKTRNRVRVGDRQALNAGEIFVEGFQNDEPRGPPGFLLSSASPVCSYLWIVHAFRAMGRFMDVVWYEKHCA